MNSNVFQAQQPHRTVPETMHRPCYRRICFTIDMQACSKQRRPFSTFIPLPGAQQCLRTGAQVFLFSRQSRSGWSSLCAQRVWQIESTLMHPNLIIYCTHSGNRKGVFFIAETNGPCYSAHNHRAKRMFCFFSVYIIFTVSVLNILCKMCWDIYIIYLFIYLPSKEYIKSWLCKAGPACCLSLSFLLLILHPMFPGNQPSHFYVSYLTYLRGLSSIWSNCPPVFLFALSFIPYLFLLFLSTPPSLPQLCTWPNHSADTKLRSLHPPLSGPRSPVSGVWQSAIPPRTPTDSWLGLGGGRRGGRSKGGMRGGRDRQRDRPSSPRRFPPALSEEVSVVALWSRLHHAEVWNCESAFWPRFASPHWQEVGQGLSSPQSLTHLSIPLLENVKVNTSASAVRQWRVTLRNLPLHFSSSLFFSFPSKHSKAFSFQFYPIYYNLLNY